MGVPMTGEITEAALAFAHGLCDFESAVGVRVDRRDAHTKKQKNCQ